MCFCRKDKKAIVARVDKHDVQATYARAKHVAALADDGSEVQKRLNSLAEELKYLSPSSREVVIKTDKKIDNAVDDLRAMIAGKKPEEKILDEIKEIDALVVYRKTLLETEI